MFQTDMEFEDEVRRIARLLWPSAEFGGSAKVNDRERDGVFVSEDFINIIECTVSRQKQKAVEDCEKIKDLVKKYRGKNSMKLVRGWFITLNEPTADQRKIAEAYKGLLQACSYDQFRARLIDARAYLQLRNKYPFGSMRDPESGSIHMQMKDYVPLDILNGTGSMHSIETLTNDLIDGKRVILTGDYGAGKSATSRELYTVLAKGFWSNSISRFPLLLNLRDHHGQQDPVEAIERHARAVGLDNPVSLVRAWRAGYCILILDGFDEIASAGWIGSAKKLRDLRYNSMALIRRFLKETPRESGILLVGRAHFFDNTNEMVAAFGNGPGFAFLCIAELGPEQVKTLLCSYGWRDVIPEWLPKRPLLLSYLAARNLLSRTLETHAAAGPAVGWNELLDRISEREAEIEAGIEPAAVRRLIERLASLARSTVEGLGPISPDDIIGAFKSICGYAPDDKGIVLLQRLPGLGGRNEEDGSRVFIDKDFVEAARSGEVFHYIEDPFSSTLASESWQTSLRSLGAEIICHRTGMAGFEAGKVIAALRRAAQSQRNQMLCADLMQVVLHSSGEYEGPTLYVHEAIIEELSFEEGEGNLSGIELQDSIIGRIELSGDFPVEKMPHFFRCHFGMVEGSTGEEDLPGKAFVECTFDEFEDTAKTTKGILSLSLPIASKVLLTILKKLYAQRGRGRRESAFYRGLDFKAQGYVQPILQLLMREGFALRVTQAGQTIWQPSKASSSRSRALRILASPLSSVDPLLIESKSVDD